MSKDFVKIIDFSTYIQGFKGKKQQKKMRSYNIKSLIKDTSAQLKASKRPSWKTNTGFTFKKDVVVFFSLHTFC